MASTDRRSARLGSSLDVCTRGLAKLGARVRTSLVRNAKLKLVVFSTRSGPRSGLPSTPRAHAVAAPTLYLVPPTCLLSFQKAQDAHHGTPALGVLHPPYHKHPTPVFRRHCSAGHQLNQNKLL